MEASLTALLVVVSIAAIIVLTSVLKLKAFVALFIVSIFLAFTTLSPDEIIPAIKEGFGNTMASIGFLIIFGAMIGVILDRTGAMHSIAGYILSKTGEKNSPMAIGITGFVTGLPIFCDSGFIILSGLAKSFSNRTSKVMPFMATVLATSLYSVHCLIPPHPGALAAAGIFNVNIGNMILAGILFAIPGAVSAWLWSKYITRNDSFVPSTGDSTGSIMNKTLPPPFLSFLPIVVPLLLITSKAIAGLFDTEQQSFIFRVLRFPGEPVFALFIGVLLGIPLIKNKSIDSINDYFTEAIEKAGPILIVTAAGGMFGMVITRTGIGEAAGNTLSQAGLGLLVPYLIAVLLKSAQGSSTVAMITAASFVLPMSGSLGLDSEWGKLLALFSMGAGSMMVSHANDSYFWVVNNFSGIDIRTTLRVYSTSTIVMSLVVFIFILLTSLFIL